MTLLFYRGAVKRVMIVIQFFTTLRDFLKTNQLSISAEEKSILELLQDCEAKTSKPFIHKLLDKDGAILPGSMILVNGRNVHSLQGSQTIVRNGEKVVIFPPAGGG